MVMKNSTFRKNVDACKGRKTIFFSHWQLCCVNHYRKVSEITCFEMVDEQRACEMKWLIITAYFSLNMNVNLININEQ